MPDERLTRQPTSCDRCGQTLVASVVSRFNTDVICLSCETNERAHPRYAEAAAAEEREVRRGNLNFAGIGKPSDL